MHFLGDVKDIVVQESKTSKKLSSVWQDGRLEENLINCHMRYTWKIAANRLTIFESSVDGEDCAQVKS